MIIIVAMAKRTPFTPNVPFYMCFRNALFAVSTSMQLSRENFTSLQPDYQILRRNCSSCISVNSNEPSIGYMMRENLIQASGPLK